MVGSNPATRPAIEAFYKSLLLCLDAHFAAGHPFLLGTRPCAADFAVLGQLHPMIALDPETSRMSRGMSPRVCAWYTYCVDLSGHSVADEGAGWIDTGAATPLPPTLVAILKLVGGYYTPFLLANAAAVQNGEATFTCQLRPPASARAPETVVEATTWGQPSFKYQAKCLKWLHEGYAELPAVDRGWVEDRLKGTGALPLLRPPPLTPKL